MAITYLQCIQTNGGATFDFAVLGTIKNNLTDVNFIKLFFSH